MDRYPTDASYTMENFTFDNMSFESSCLLNPDVQYGIGMSISVIGVTANLAFMYVVAQIPTMRTVLNAYLVNLAVADLFHLVWHVAIWIGYFQDSTTETEYCAMMYFSRLYQYVSLFTVAVLSIERYLAICKPVIYRDSMIHKVHFIAYMIVLIWFLSCVISSEALVDCFAHTESRALAGRIIFLSTVFAVMVVIFVMYNLIILAARNSPRPVLSRQKERQIVRICLATSMLHFLCLLPIVLQTVLFMIQFDASGQVLLTHDVFCLANISTYFLEINSSANPFIYNILSSTYRQAFKHAFFCRHHTHPHGRNRNLRHLMSTNRSISTRNPASTVLSPNSHNNSKDVCSV